MLLLMMVLRGASSLRVGVIGGGMSGLSCASKLNEAGVEVVVFDTGRRRVGGRCSSRLASDDNSDFAYAIDHAAQFAALSPQSHSAWHAFVAEAAARGTLREWKGYGQKLVGRPARSVADGSVDYFVGASTRGLGGLACDLEAALDIETDVWVPPNGGLSRLKRGWRITHGRERVDVDAVVIAHNGKCAERLTSRLQTPVAPLLRARFGTRPHASVLTLTSVYSLVVELRDTVDLDGFDALKIRGHPVLAYVSDNAAKLDWAARESVLTLHSTATFAKANKHPQEALAGTDVEARVVRDMLNALQDVLGVGADAASTCKLQLWGAALPLNRWDANFVWDAESRIGVVGDWLSEDPRAASTLEAAFVSGHALANHVTTDASRSAGLERTFVSIRPSLKRRRSGQQSRRHSEDSRTRREYRTQGGNVRF